VEKRNVGKSGLRVSAVGLGCNNFGWTLDEEQSRKIIHTALDRGITLFDTAPVYGTNGGESEEILGRALGNRRKDAVVVTKFGVPLDRTGRFNTSRAAIMEEIDASLKRLNTDYIDIYMLHWPDPTTPLQETLRALDDIITAGKARYIGCSNLSAWRLVESKWISRTERLHDFIVTQNEYSLAQREADTSLLPALEEYGVAFMPYAPLANGLLTGKYSAAAPAPEDSRLGKNMWNLANRYLTEDKLQLAESLGRFAADRGHTLLELAISWLLSKSLVCSVIGGATKPGQVATNAAAGTGWRLGPEELVEVDRICRESRRDSRN
jgi:aryl-alcohol dehydrogenase-like predicted oxidoreductase